MTTMIGRAFRRSDGTEIQPGDEVRDFRGLPVTFHRVTRHADGRRAAKIQVGDGHGPEYYATGFPDVEVREICAVCQGALDRTDVSGQPDEFVHLGDGHEDHVPVRAGHETGAVPATAYKFDLVAVVTITVTTTAGEDAARHAASVIEAIEPGSPVEVTDDVAPGTGYEVTCIAPRGKAYLVSANPDGTSTVLDESIPEPLTDGARDVLRDAVAEADEALGGDSNDAEHEALWSVRETMAGLLGIDRDPPSPYGDGDGDGDGDGGAGGLVALMDRADLETLIHSAAELWDNANQIEAQRGYLSERQVSVLNRAVRLLGADNAGLSRELTRLAVSRADDLDGMSRAVWRSCHHSVACPCLGKLEGLLARRLGLSDADAEQLAAYLWDQQGTGS